MTNGVDIVSLIASAAPWVTTVFENSTVNPNAMLSAGDMTYVSMGGTVVALSTTSHDVLSMFTPPAMADTPAGMINYGMSFAMVPDGSALIYGVALPIGPYNSYAQVAVFSLDPKTLSLKWQKNLWTVRTISTDNFYLSRVPVACAEGVIYVGASQCVAMLDPANGTVFGQVGTENSSQRIFPCAHMALSRDGAMLCLVDQADVQLFNCSTHGGLPALTLLGSYILDQAYSAPSPNAMLGTYTAVIGVDQAFLVGYNCTVYRITPSSVTSVVVPMPYSVNAPVGPPLTLSLSPDGDILYGSSAGQGFSLDPTTLATRWRTTDRGLDSLATGPDGCCFSSGHDSLSSEICVFDRDGTMIAQGKTPVDWGTGSGFIAWAGRRHATLLVGGGGRIGGIPIASLATPKVAGTVSTAAHNVAAKDAGLLKRVDAGHQSWMADRAASLGKVPLRRIALPGTHDSGTFAITSSSEIGKDAEHSTGKSIIAAWAKAQERNFLQQLNDGIRYLDLRIQYADREFSITHTLVSTTVQTLFDQIKEFYETPANSREIVILDFSHFYGFVPDDVASIKRSLDRWDKLAPSEKQVVITKMKDAKLDVEQVEVIFAKGKADMNDLISQIRTQLGGISVDLAPSQLPQQPSAPATGCLIERSAGLDVTPNQIWSGTGRIIVMWGDDRITNFADHPYLWPSSDGLRSKWPNTMDIDDLHDRLNTEVHQPHSTFWVLQGILTPDTLTIVKDVGDSTAPAVALAAPMLAVGYTAYKHLVADKDSLPYKSLEEVARYVDPRLDTWLATDWSKMDINIVIADYYNITPYVATVIALNNRYD